MNSIAIIPARSGSKGLPDKNILSLNGKPLLAWSIEAARQSGMFDTIHVSTDSEKYAEIARQHGADVPFLRSPETSTDTASSSDVITEVLFHYQNIGKYYDSFMLLQPTSPLRTAEDICGAFRTMEQRNAKTVVSVCETDHSPLWCNTLPENLRMDKFISAAAGVPRQSLPKYYQLNGAVYLAQVNDFLRKGKIVYDMDCYAYIMPEIRSIDIDKKSDFLIAGIILRHTDDFHIEDNTTNAPPRTLRYKNVFISKTLSNLASPIEIESYKNTVQYTGQAFVSLRKGVPVC